MNIAVLLSSFRQLLDKQQFDEARRMVDEEHSLTERERISFYFELANAQPCSVFSIGFYEQQSEREGDNPLWSEKLAETYASNNEIFKAVEVLETFNQRHPDNHNILFNIAWYAEGCGDYGKAIRFYKRCLEKNIEQPEEVHLKLAVIYTDHYLDKLTALKHYREALSLSPGYKAGLFDYGGFLQKTGDYPAAKDTFESLLSTQEYKKRALARLVEFPGDHQSADIARLANQVSSHFVSPGAFKDNDDVDLVYAVARWFDSRNDYDTASRLIVQANNADLAQSHLNIQSIKECHRKRLTGIQAWHKTYCRIPQNPVSELDDVSPVFICGPFRSGSTLLEKQLSAHPLLCSGGEIDHFFKFAPLICGGFPPAAEITSESIDRIRRTYLKRLDALRTTADAIVLDKRPDNIEKIGFIKTLFPRARFICTGRNHKDIATSLLFNRFGPAMSYSLTTETALDYLEHQQILLSYWQTHYEEDILTVSYEDMVANQADTVDTALRWLGLDPAARNSGSDDNGIITTASMEQVRQPLHNRSVGRWNHYSELFGN